MMIYIGAMKESYHICFTSHDEVLFRDEEDHGMFVNLMAVRGFMHDTEILVDAEMSTHVHLNVFSEKPFLFAGILRMSYTKYFNYKYGRSGRLGQKNAYVVKIDGFYHQLTAENYVLRNALHHGVSATAFGYPYCAVRDLFAKDIGLSTEKPASYSRDDIRSYLPVRSEFPDHYRMNSQGVFLRNSFMEIRKAEQYYGSPRNYLYQMNRLTDDSWSKDQLLDGTGSPITLADIEQADEKSVARMLNNEYGRNFSHSKMQDLDVCRLIDDELLPASITSPYLLNNTQKQKLVRQLFFDFHLPKEQIQRCLP